ncbi:DASH complex, subunit Spc34 [Aureobasidium pullulans]|uniref:DASH complex subunit SPC34 n=1 Tax=Aureobasidium pullulans TaxID=5580 RepID=A0A4S9TRJ9_AURPU|nr:DASH complex, subunit Spc34 [Aureobasidium pullulans]
MTSSLLSSHLDQIALCASSISDLPFSRPKQFTNALLTHHDITALIRDTEQHERALFSIAPPPVPSKSQIQQISSTFTTSASRSIVAPNTQRPPRRHTAVAAVLGGDLYRKTRSGHSGKQAKGDIDVELLLRGAEKLCRVYPIPGAFDRIGELRNRYAQLSANIAHYEERVAMQSAELDHLHQNHDDYDQDDYDDHDDHVEPTLHMSKEDLMNEEDEIRALEDKKRALQSRVTSMEKDIEAYGKSIQIGYRLESHQSIKTSDRFQYSMHDQSARRFARCSGPCLPSPYVRICHFWPSPATTPGVFRPVKMHSVFEIGIFVRREALDHDLHPPQAIHIEINVNNDDADVVAQTIFQLVEEICEYFKDDQNAYSSIFDTPEKRLLVAQKIYNGMKRVKVLPDYVDDNTETLIDILTNPDFCISDICKLRRVEITDVPNLIVNYLMVFSDFPDARDPGIYDGKSLQIGGTQGANKEKDLQVSLSVDGVLLLNTIVHFDALINAHHRGVRVEVTKFSIQGGGTQGANKEKDLQVSLSVDDVPLLNTIVHFDALINAHRCGLRVDVMCWKLSLGPQQSLHIVLNDRHLPVQANGSSEGIVGDTSSRPTSIFKDVLSNTEQIFGEVAIGGELSSLWVAVVMEIEHAVVDGLEQENCDLLGERNNIDVVVFQIANVVHVGLASFTSGLPIIKA